MLQNIFNLLRSSNVWNIPVKSSFITSFLIISIACISITTVLYPGNSYVAFHIKIFYSSEVHFI